MNKNQPLVSIVMPSFNQASYIERSISSILNQSYANLEVIVSDGGSTDETVDRLSQLAIQDARLKWTSEKDDGPAHAINKSLALVRGEIVGWLNSDDLFAPDCVAHIVRYFAEHSDMLMCYGHGEHVDANDQHLGRYPTSPPEKGMLGFSTGCFICQPTVFFKTPLLSMVGTLDQTLEASFDYDLWFRIFRDVPDRIGFIDRVLAYSRLHDDCITQRMRNVVAREGMQLSFKYLGNADLHWAATYLEELRHMTKGDEDFSLQARAFVQEIAHLLTDAQKRDLSFSLNTF